MTAPHSDAPTLQESMQSSLLISAITASPSIMTFATDALSDHGDRSLAGDIYSTSALVSKFSPSTRSGMSSSSSSFLSSPSAPFCRLW